MSRGTSYLKVVTVTLMFILISTLCAAGTIRTQRKLGLLEGMTGVITNIAGTRVTVAPDEWEGDTVTLHQKDASGLKVGDTVMMQSGILVKIDPQPPQPDKPAQPVPERSGETGTARESKEAPEAKEPVKDPAPAGQAAPAQSQQR